MKKPKCGKVCEIVMTPPLRARAVCNAQVVSQSDALTHNPEANGDGGEDEEGEPPFPHPGPDEWGGGEGRVDSGRV